MSFTIFDTFGNLVSIFLILFRPIRLWLFNTVMEMKNGFDGASEQKNTYKAYISYAENFSTLVTSLIFSLANSIYLMYKDSPRWEYIAFGFGALILIFGLLFASLYLSQYSIDQPFTQFIYERGDYNFDIDDTESFPTWARLLWFLNPTRVFMTLCIMFYAIPSLLIFEKAGYIQLECATITHGIHLIHPLY